MATIAQDRLSQLAQFFHQNQSVLVAHYPGLSLQRLIREIQDLSERSNFHFADYLQQLLTGRPLEYLAGQAWFYRSPFFVNEQVLIPRKETERLVELAAQQLRQSWKADAQSMPVHVWEVGTGSGAIILSLLQELPFPVIAFASDLSLAALQVAQQNYFRLQYTIHPQTQLHFVQMDRLAQATAQYSLIISNPPYLKTCSDRSRVHQQVFAYEPHLALFIGDEEYHSWYQEFFLQVRAHLLPGGLFCCEGDELHLATLLPIAQSVGLIGVTIISDYHGCDRYLCAQG